MKNIKLGYDKDGNYLVDFAGLIYLIQEGCVVEGACVYMTESSGNISEYILVRDTEAGLSRSKNLSLVLVDAEPDTIYLEVDAYAFSAKYLILAEDVSLNNSNTNAPAVFKKIHYEEALTRMKKGEVVYFQEKKDVYVPKENKDFLTAAMVMDGSWFLKEEIYGYEEDKQEDKNNLSKTDRLLMDLFDMKESEYIDFKKEFQESEKIDSDSFSDYSFDDDNSNIIEELSPASMREVLHTLYENDMISIKKANDGSDVDYFVELNYFDDEMFDDYDDEWLDGFI